MNNKIRIGSTYYVLDRRESTYTCRNFHGCGSAYTQPVEDCRVYEIHADPSRGGVQLTGGDLMSLIAIIAAETGSVIHGETPEGLTLDYLRHHGFIDCEPGRELWEYGSAIAKAKATP